MRLAAGAGEWMAGEEGFEPSHAGIKILCLNQLGDSPAVFVPYYNRASKKIYHSPLLSSRYLSG